MSEFKRYKLTQIAELRPVTIEEADHDRGKEYYSLECAALIYTTLISCEDWDNGSPKIGDMIARSSKNHNHQWLISKEDFEENYKEL